MIEKPRLYLTDANGVRQTELIGYASLTYHQPLNAVGKWNVIVPRDIGAAIRKGWGLEMHLPSGSTLSGRVWKVDTRPGATQSGVFGVNDLHMLAARQALPNPNGDFSAQAYDARSGAVESVVKGYVKDNASNAALIEARRWPFSVATDAGRGESVTARARFYNLLAFIRALIDAAGGEFRLSLNAGVFDTERVLDRRGAPMFADWMSGVEFGYAWEAPDVNYIYAGGQGELENRTIVERYDPAAVVEYWRIEDFLDYRNAANATELSQAADARLVRGAPSEGYRVSVAGEIHYGDKYKEGDLITVQVGGKAFDARIEGVAIRYDGRSGWREEIGVGVPAMAQLIDAIRQADLTERVRNLEVV